MVWVRKSDHGICYLHIIAFLIPLTPYIPYLGKYKLFRFSFMYSFPFCLFYTELLDADYVQDASFGLEMKSHRTPYRHTSPAFYFFFNTFIHDMT